MSTALTWGLVAGALTFVAAIGGMEWLTPATPAVVMRDGEEIHLKGDHSRPWLAFAGVGCLFAVGAGICGALWRYTRPD